MSAMLESLDAGFAVVKRDFRMMTSYRFRFVSTLFGAFFSLTLFYYISRLVRVEAFASPDAYYAFAVTGLITLQLLNSTLQTPPGSLRQELVAGTFERIVTTPFGPVGTALAMMVFPFLFALALALVMLGFSGVVFGVSLHWATLPLVIPLSALGAAAFAAFGVALLALTLLAKQILAGTTFIVAGISLIAGLYFPVTLLPDWIEWTSDVQPFTPSVDLLRWALIGRPLPDPAWLDLVRVVGFTAVLLPLAVLLLRKAVRVSQRRGTITEY
jgi:ABC-2 type transport system permease protein